MLSALLVPTSLFAQNEEDALRYSQLHFGGTARYNSVAGAFGALGADLSVLSSNPAGMARFRNSEFSFTPQLTLENSSATFMGNNTINGKENLNISNIGLVGVSKAGKDSPSLWRSVQFGLAYNRLANFHDRFQINGVNDTSMSYVFAARAGGIHPDDIYDVAPFDAAIAYDAYVIDPGDTNNLGSYYTTQMYMGDFEHTHTSTRSGSIGETALSVSGNYNDKFYIGGSIGFPKIRYESTKVHNEIAQSDSLDIHSFTYTEYLSTRGNGINMKLGFVFLPIKWLRIGGAIHTPTKYYYMRDGWNTKMESSFRNGDSYTSYSPDGSYVYKLKTPGRLIGNAAIIIAKRGMVSVDYEYVDYASSSLINHGFSGDSYNFALENNTIVENYRSTHNIRLGSELRVSKPFMVRAGVAYYQNPHNSEVVENQTPKLTYSAGFGYRVKEWYVDFGYSMTKWTEDYYMYDPILVENTPIKRTLSNAMITVGFKY